MRCAFIISLCLLAACNPTTENTITTDSEPANESAPATNELEGIWQLQEWKIVNQDDTSVVQHQSRQHKIYFQGYYMWNREVPYDSVEWHGFGIYEIQADDTLMEMPITSSIPEREYMEHAGITEFKIAFNLRGDTFTQTIYNPVRDLYNIQTYHRIRRSAK